MNRYYYEVDTQTFYKMPQVFYNPESKYVKLKSLTKELYMLLMDRNSLSVSNGWVDKNGRIFFYFKQEDLKPMLNTSKQTLTNSFKELLENNLIEIVRQGLNKPNIIYLLKPDEMVQKTVEKTVKTVEKQAQSQEDTGVLEIRNQEVLDLGCNHTKYNKTEKTLKHDSKIVDSNGKKTVSDVEYDKVEFNKIVERYSIERVKKIQRRKKYKEAIIHVNDSCAYLSKCCENDLIKEREKELKQMNELYTTQQDTPIEVTGYYDNWMDE